MTGRKPVKMPFRTIEVEEEGSDAYMRTIAELQKPSDHRHECMSSVLIVESAARVKRICSTSVYVLFNHPRCLTPRMFQALALHP